MAIRWVARGDLYAVNAHVDFEAAMDAVSAFAESFPPSTARMHCCAGSPLEIVASEALRWFSPVVEGESQAR